jgi:hypothetical protein
VAGDQADPQADPALVVVRGESLLKTATERVAFTSVADPGICRVDQFHPTEVSIAGVAVGRTTVTLWFAAQGKTPLNLAVDVVTSVIPSDDALLRIKAAIVAAVGSSNQDGFALTPVRDLGKLILSGKVDFDKSKFVRRILVGSSLTEAMLVNNLELRFPAPRLTAFRDQIKAAFEFHPVIESLDLRPSGNNLIAEGTIAAEPGRQAAVLAAIRDVELFPGQIIDFLEQP